MRGMEQAIQGFEVDTIAESYAKLERQGRSDEITSMETQLRDQIEPVLGNIRDLVSSKIRNNRLLLDDVGKLLALQPLEEHIFVVKTTWQQVMEVILNQLKGAERNIKECMHS